MKFSEVIGLLTQGKKMRSLAWMDDAYISLIDGDIVDGNGCSYNFIEDDVIDEWEEYIEPETKKIEKLSGLSLAFLTPTEINTSIMKKINELIEVVNELC